MRLNISNWALLVMLVLLNSSCGNFYTISKDRISPVMRNFEIAKLIVYNIHSKKKYPIKYDKEIVIVCSNTFIIDSTEKYFKYSYKNIEDYWKDYEKLDSLYESSYKKNKLDKVRFFEKQSHVNWIKFPFYENELLAILPIKFEKNTWYKISHLDNYHIGLNIVIFIIIDDKGKFHQFQIIED